MTEYSHLIRHAHAEYLNKTGKVLEELNEADDFMIIQMIQSLSEKLKQNQLSVFQPMEKKN